MGGVVNELICGIRENQQEPPEARERLVQNLLELVWVIAIKEKKAGDGGLLESLLASGEAVPVSAAMQLPVKGPKSRPPHHSNKEVVEAVQLAIIHGHPYRGENANDNPAFVEAARQLGYNPGTIQRKWFEVKPDERRNEIRDEVKKLWELLVGTTSKTTSGDT